MILTLCYALPLLITCVFAKGGKGGGGGGGGGGSTSVYYSESECYTSSLTPLYTMGNETNGHTNGTKLSNYWYYIFNDGKQNASINYLTTLHPSVNWNMEVLDAYYNGTFTITLNAPPANATFDCPTLHSQTIPDAFLRLGPQSNRNNSRESYGDKNSYYFHFGRTIRDVKCPYTANKAFVNFESSNDNLDHAQVWTLSQKKKGDHFELDGSLTSTQANYNNFWNYVVNTTGTDQGYKSSSCPTTFSSRTLLVNSQAKMNATVSNLGAALDFEFIDVKGYKIAGTFEGKPWDKGPKILFDKDTIQTEGQIDHVKPHPPSQSFLSKYGKYIFIGGAIIVAIVILYILWHWFKAFIACIGCLTCNWCSPCRKKRSSHAKPSTKISDRDASQAFIDKQPSVSIMAMDNSSKPHTDDISYQVPPAVAESYTIVGGNWYVEITNAQNDLHKAHIDLRNAKARGDSEGMNNAQRMVKHYEQVIGHFMQLRKAGM